MTWHGPYSRGAMRAHRIARQQDAARRSADTPPGRTKAHRLGPLNQHGHRTRRSILRHLPAKENTRMTQLSGTNGPAVSLDNVPPGLVSLAKSAAVSLEKSGLTGRRAAVYLVLDHSGSMRGFYQNGSVQRLAEQTLGLSANLDDDATVPLVFFGTRASVPIPVALDDYRGVVDREHAAVAWGTTDYVAAMLEVVDHYTASRSTDPALVVFQSDGAPNSRSAAERALRNASGLPLFWAFVGFGARIEFLEKLDGLRGRRVDNASFFHAADPHRVSDAELYDGITHEYAGWLAAATAAGIVR